MGLGDVFLIWRSLSCQFLQDIQNNHDSLRRRPLRSNKAVGAIVVLLQSVRLGTFTVIPESP